MFYNAIVKKVNINRACGLLFLFHAILDGKTKVYSHK